MPKKPNPSPSRTSPKTVAVGVEMVLPPSAVLRASVTGPPPVEVPRERAPEAVARPAQMVLEVPTLSYPPAAADPPPVGDLSAPYGICANCDRPAVIRTNFRWTPSVGFCNLHIPAQYRYLLGG